MLFREAVAPTWIVVFLGNPGAKYVNTRHNVGWLAADEVETQFELQIKRVKFRAFTAAAYLGDASTLLMKPQTFMNRSGLAVAEAARFYKTPADRIIAVYDDLDLPPGKLRVKRGGSDGGHNGIRSIIDGLGAKEFPRVKLGIGRPPQHYTGTIDWVLGKPSEADLTAIQSAIALVPDVLTLIINSGVELAMNKYNSLKPPDD